MSEKGDQFIRERSETKIEVLERVISDLEDKVKHLEQEADIWRKKCIKAENKLLELQHKKG